MIVRRDGRPQRPEPAGERRGALRITIDEQRHGVIILIATAPETVDHAGSVLRNVTKA